MDAVSPTGRKGLKMQTTTVKLEMQRAKLVDDIFLAEEHEYMDDHLSTKQRTKIVQRVRKLFPGVKLPVL